MSCHIWSSTEYTIFTSFLQHFRVYWQSYRWGRDLKFGVHLIYMSLFTHVKFYPNAAIFSGAFFKKVQKNGLYTAFCSILANLPMRWRHEILSAYRGHSPACPWQISRQCHVFLSRHIWCCTEYPILTSFLQHIRVYWQSYRWARDLKFGMHLRYMF